MPRTLRPPRADDLGLRRALSDRLLPFLVAAMAFLAAIALAGAVAAATLARHWQEGAAAVLTVQVPQPGDAGDEASRVAKVAAQLRDDPGIATVRVLPEDELRSLLRPWLGSGEGLIALPLPAVLEVRLRDANADLAILAQRLDTAAPGTLVEGHRAWLQRLGTLARSLQACAALAMLVVAAVAVAVIAVATRAGLAARREAIGVVHELGATDGYIAAQFARRVTRLAFGGAVAGTLAAVPLLAGLAQVAAPFATPDPAPTGLVALGGAMPLALWGSLALLPPIAAGIGWLTAQGTVRRWLRRLP